MEPGVSVRLELLSSAAESHPFELNIADFTRPANSLGTGYCVAGMVKGKDMERYVGNLGF